MADPAAALPVSPLRVAIGGLVALAAALGIGRFVYTPILPEMVAALHLTKAEAGLIASANFIGYLAGAMAATSPIFGSARRFWLLTGLVANAVALLAMALTVNVALYLAIRFIAGLASGFVMVFGSALVMERLAAGRRSSLSAIYFMGPGVGIALSAVLVAILVAFGTPWSGLWLANAIVSIIALGSVAWAIPGDGLTTTTAKPTTPAQPLGHSAILLAGAYGLVGFGYVITSTFIVTLVRETPSIVALEPYIWVIVGITAVPSVAVWVACARLSSPMRAFAAAAVLEAIGVAASVVSPTVGGIVLAAVLLGGTFMGLTAMGLIAVRTMIPGDPRRGIGLLTAVFGIGQIIGPVVAGFLHDITGTFTEATYLAAACLIVSAGLALAADRKPTGA